MVFKLFTFGIRHIKVLLRDKGIVFLGIVP